WLFSMAKIRSCLRMRLAFSMPLATAISTSCVTWCAFSSDRCMGIATAPFVAWEGGDSVPVDERTSGWTACGLLILGIGAWDFGAERLRKTTYCCVRLYGVQMLLSRKAVSCDLESAPTRVASTLPFLNSIRVGMPRMPNFAGTCWFSSTLILAIFRRPWYSLATSSRIGAMDLQGPHHSAQ